MSNNITTTWPIHYIAIHQAHSPDACYCDQCFGVALGLLLAEEPHHSITRLAKRLKMDPDLLAHIIFSPKSPQGFISCEN